MARPKGTGKYSNAQIVRALCKGGSDVEASRLLGYPEGSRTVYQRRRRMNLKWVAIPEDLIDEITEMAVARQREIDAFGSGRK